METMSDLLGVIAFGAICLIAAMFPQLFDTMLIAAVVLALIVAAIRKRKEHQ